MQPQAIEIDRCGEPSWRENIEPRARKAIKFETLGERLFSKLMAKHFADEQDPSGVSRGQNPSRCAKSASTFVAEILNLDGFGMRYCQIKWIFRSIMAPTPPLISLKWNSHAKKAPDSRSRARVKPLSLPPPDRARRWAASRQP
jgi:hypothetical protein